MLKSKFVENAGVVRPMTFNNITDVLPRDTYSIEGAPGNSLFLQRRESFEIPSKIYGKSDFPQVVKRTFNKLGRGMAVLLSGPKGTGKTVDAKLICLNSEKPVLIINHAINGALTDFLESIHTPSVIFIDEFEKIYPDEDTRNMFLSILDGTSSSRHLFVLTSNNPAIGEYFENRPNRIRYHKKYTNLSDELIEEIIDDKLQNPQWKSDIIRVVNDFSEISMDGLTCIIEECNLHDTSPHTFMNYFNVNERITRSFNLKIERTIVYNSGKKEKHNFELKYAYINYILQPDGSIQHFEFRGTDESTLKAMSGRGIHSQIKHFKKNRKAIEVKLVQNLSENDDIDYDYDLHDAMAKENLDPNKEKRDVMLYVVYNIKGTPSRTY